MDTIKWFIAGLTFFVMVKYNAGLVEAFIGVIVVLAIYGAIGWYMSETEYNHAKGERWYAVLFVAGAIIYAISIFTK